MHTMPWDSGSSGVIVIGVCGTLHQTVANIGAAGWSHNCLVGESMHTMPRAGGSGFAIGNKVVLRCTWSH